MDTKKLRQKILDLAIRGKLVPQDPNDEPASVLLERIKEEKERLIKEGKIKKSKRTLSSDTYPYGNVPFKVPDNWEWCKITEIAEALLGKTLDRDKDKGNFVKYLCAVNVQWGRFDLSIQKQFRIKDKDMERYSVIKGDLLVCEGGDVGRSAIWENDCTTFYQNALHRLRFKRGIKQYFYLYTLMYYKSKGYIDDVCKGVTIKHFTQNAMQSLWFPLPPLAEQQRIIAEVERWFAFIEQIEQDKADLQVTIKQTKSKILNFAIHGKLVPQDPNDEPASELLKRINPKAEITSDNEHYENLPNGWCYASIKEVFTINPKNKADDSSEAGFISMTNISDGYFNTFRYEIRQWNEVKTGFTHFADGDIAVAKISPCLENRKSIILKDLPNGIGAGTTELYIFRSQCIDAKYGLFFFKSDYFINQCINSFNGVVGQQRVSKSIIEDIDIAIPPLEEQMRIANIVSLLFSTLDKIAEEL